MIDKVSPLFSGATSVNLFRDTGVRNVSEVWLSARWIERQKYFLERSLLGEFPRYSSLPSLLKSSCETLNVVDYGGGSGWLYHSIKSLKVKIKKYTVIEILDLHEYCGKQHLDYLFIATSEFRGRIIPKGDNVLYLNSVIQYFESIETLSRIIEAVKPKYVLIDDLTFASGSEFFAFQKYYEDRIPYRFQGRDSLLKTMMQFELDLLVEKNYERHISPIFAYKLEEESSVFKIGKTKTLLFGEIGASGRL